MAETLPTPGVEIEDGCRVRPGLIHAVGGSRLSRLAGGQLPVTICHQESLWACFMSLYALQVEGRSFQLCSITVLFYEMPFV